jgi:uncharacterized lipoprotein YajG
MKKYLFILLAVFLVAGCSQEAEAGQKTCENSQFWNAVANECSPHTVDTDTHAKQRDQAGVGADVVVWQNETDKATFIEEVVAEYKYDIDNEAHSIFGVVRVNLWQKIKGLFNRGE